MECLYGLVHEGRSFVPVYCFDPREASVSEHQDPDGKFFDALVRQVKSLRCALRRKGSDLLVVNGFYERMIPSLARVLQVKNVVSLMRPPDSFSANDPLMKFRSEKEKEIDRLLNMHSIPFQQGISGSAILSEPALFPAFPDINPGQIPAYPSGKQMRTG
jgi:deoxyribodipyrimidine photolyase